MLLKEFQTTHYKIALESLNKRLNPRHEKALKIEEELSLQEAGEIGEKQLLTILTESQLPKNTFILHNVNLQSIFNIQIDVMVISHGWCLILEVKNLTGELIFNNNPPQLICIKEENKIAYRSPESQLDQYLFGLSKFFEQHQLKVPIHGAISLPFTNAIIKTPPSKYPLLLGRAVINHIWSLPKKDIIPSKQVADLVLQHNAAPSWNQFPLSRYYGIDPADIQRGVECPHCGAIPMKRLKRTWFCEKCKKRHMHAHVKALKDYYMLIDKYISPKEAMHYLRLRNRYEAKRILKANSKSRIGNTSRCKYELSLQ
ncbi:nuclease-related domain-containing protein [Ureibacillus terrenus]|uniref:nuclease-related domain-containing protein n=1 Tax=Ureibacillus terrenus TaxID=118246 RepID=UPI002E1C8C23|nr:nuclease-related domain-containing protein [Ureibacillus terrenus]